MAHITHLVDKTYEDKSFTEIADSPVDALEGVSAGDADLLKKAFNIKTVRDLGTNKFFMRAAGIVALASAERK
jgi:hypothetical protein